MNQPPAAPGHEPGHEPNDLEVPGPVEPAEVWTDAPDIQPGSGKLLQPRNPVHFNQMQTRVLYGVGAFFLLTMLMIVLGPWIGAIREDFAREIMQTVLPPLLASGATIIGTLFASERARDRGQ